jgi:hypothetical protein
MLKAKELANLCPQNIEELKTETRKAVNRIRRKPKMVRSFFRGSPLFQAPNLKQIS